MLGKWLADYLQILEKEGVLNPNIEFYMDKGNIEIELRATKLPYVEDRNIQINVSDSPLMKINSSIPIKQVETDGRDIVQVHMLEMGSRLINEVKNHKLITQVNIVKQK